jgi:hypothetical protein
MEDTDVKSRPDAVAEEMEKRQGTWRQITH